MHLYFRGYVFTHNVDDAPSECDLDDGVTFDLHINNDGNDNELQQGTDKLLSIVNSRLKATNP